MAISVNDAIIINLAMKKNSHNRRCNKCRYDESPTAGTTFEKLKFSISIDFHIVFKICTKKKKNILYKIK